MSIGSGSCGDDDADDDDEMRTEEDAIEGRIEECSIV